MDVEHFILRPDDWVPNNSTLPVLHYRRVMGTAGSEAIAAGYEAVFARNGWPAQWRDGIFDYHHYHSTAHEVLGVAGGTAEVLLGGPGGRRVTLTAGDVVVLPVGTGHCKLTASTDFLVVGAYPAGQNWDICRSEPTAETRAKMASLPFPEGDPVAGENGPLMRLWLRA